MFIVAQVKHLEPVCMASKASQSSKKLISYLESGWAVAKQRA